MQSVRTLREATVQTRDLKDNECALLLHGLRAIYVADDEKTRLSLIQKLEGELASRGKCLPDPAKV
jgi:hypothetical protein